MPDVSLPTVPDLKVPDVSLPDVSLPSLPGGLELPSLPSLPLDALTGVVDEELLPIVATAVLGPIGLFSLLLLIDALVSIPKLFSGDKKPKGATPEPEGGSVGVPPDTFDEELSLWPAILEIQRSLATMAPEEQRRVKLETGTNWPPRTTTTKPFQVDREGYMFFQGPTPKTGVQSDLPSFFSGANFKDVQIPSILPLLAGVGGLSSIFVLFVLITNGVSF